MTATSVIAFDLWIRLFHPARSDAPRLLCLPQAGGAASFFLPMSAGLAPAVEVLAVQYPGRQERYREKPYTRIGDLVDELFPIIAALDDRPLAILGHSMGAVIGFELARRLERVGRPPAVLFASARRAPSIERDDTVHLRPDQEMLREIAALGGTDRAVLRDPEVQAMILPALRADYKAVETYRRPPGEPLICPIVVMTGDADPGMSLADAERWSTETTGPFEVVPYPGGHFYLIPQQRAVLEQLAGHLATFAG